MVGPLHRLIAAALVAKPSRLTYAEIRWLREEAGWTAVQFAARIGVEPTHVSRWENGVKRPGAVADRLIRMVYAAALKAGDPFPMLETINDATTPIALTLRHDRDGWIVDGTTGEAR